MGQEDVIRLIDLDRQENVLALLALQLAAYFKEAETIGLTDAPPLWDSPAALRASGEQFYGLYAAEGMLSGAISVKPEGCGKVAADSPAGRTQACTLRICRLMVHPGRLRQGFASRLVRHILLLTVAEPVSTVTVSAITANTAAIALYSGFGFQPVRLQAGADGYIRQELAVDAAAYRQFYYSLLLPETE